MNFKIPTGARPMRLRVIKHGMDAMFDAVDNERTDVCFSEGREAEEAEKRGK
jgi:hypothetical protein